MTTIRHFLDSAVVACCALFIACAVAGAAAWAFGREVGIPGVASFLAGQENGLPAFYITPHWTGTFIWVVCLAALGTYVQLHRKRGRDSATPAR